MELQLVLVFCIFSFSKPLLNINITFFWGEKKIEEGTGDFEYLRGRSRGQHRQTWKKTFFFTPARFEQKLFYPRKCVTCDKSEFATKQRKMCISKIRLPHIYRSNNYVIINKTSSSDSNIKKNTK